MKHVIFFLLFLFSFFYGEAQVSPPSVPGLQLWFRADSGVVSDPSNNKVSEWQDLSGNNNHATQTAFSNQPVLEDSVKLLNNRSVLRFDGFDDFMDFPDQGNLITAFLVLKYDTLTDFQTILGNDAAYDFISGPGTAFFHSQFTNSGILTGRTFMNGSPVLPTQLQKPSEYSIIEVQAVTPFNVGNLGKERNFPWYFQGEVAEIIIYNDSIDQIERIGIENYLRNRYAPPVDLGSDYTVPYGFCDQSVKSDDRFVSYQWSTGETTDSIMTNEGGTFWLSVTDVFGFLSSDTISVQFPVFGRPSKTIICVNDTLTWNTGLPAGIYDFMWNDGSTQPFLDIFSAGAYSVQVTDTNGCSIEDTINFSVDNFSQVFSLGADTQYCSGSIIQPVSGILPGNDYQWSTGESTPYSIAVNPGLYFVSVTDSNNCIASDSINITISGSAAVPAFSEGIKCEGSPVQFIDQSDPPSGAQVVTWDWSFGDNQNSSIEDPAHLYPDTGLYNVTLSITTDQGCTSAIVKQIRITSKPSAAFATSNACEKAGTKFTNNTVSVEQIAGYNWDFGTLSPSDSSSLANPEFTYSDDDEYSVTLIITTTHGCSDTISKPVTVNPKPIANFITGPACEAQNTLFLDSSIIAFPWSIIPGSVRYDFGDGYIGSNPTMNHIYQDTGTYTVRYFFTASNGCKDTVLKNVHVYSLPVANFTSLPVCTDQTITFKDISTSPDDILTKWTWSIGGSDLDHDREFDFLSDTTGSFSLKLSVRTSEGCSNSVTKPVTINATPVAAFSLSVPRGNPPAEVSFTNSSSGATSYIFDFNDGSAPVNSFPASHTYLNTGSYFPQLIAIAASGCRDSSVEEFIVLEKYLDIAINNVIYSVKDSFLNVTAEFINISNSDVSSLELILDVQDGNAIKDELPAIMRYQGASYIHTFSALKVSSENRTFCVYSRSPNKEPDMKPENNLVCRSISDDQFEVVLYPNPVSETLYLDLHSDSDQQINTRITDARGRLVLPERSYQVMKGFNRNSFDVSVLEKGVYTVIFTYSGQVLVRQFIKE